MPNAGSGTRASSVGSRNSKAKAVILQGGELFSYNGVFVGNVIRHVENRLKYVQQKLLKKFSYSYDITIYLFITIT